MKVKKRTLFLIAFVVWAIAGYNVLKLGLEEYKEYLSFINIFLSVVVFCFFYFLIFNKLVKKHTIRIGNFKDDMQFFLNFFDLKSYIIMISMITFGILLRKFNLVSHKFVAVFYSGLGAALFYAGVAFGLNYFKFISNNHN